jgi:quercetin dioxygenase-like cupin family protein
VSAFSAPGVYARQGVSSVWRRALEFGLAGDLSVPGREVVQVLAELPAPKGTTGRHTHPREEVSYVMDGTLTLEVDGAPARTLKAGDAFLIPAGKIHNATNPGAGSAKVLATYVVEKGKPLTTPVPWALNTRAAAPSFVGRARSGAT